MQGSGFAGRKLQGAEHGFASGSTSPWHSPVLPPGWTVPVSSFPVPLEPLLGTEVMPPTLWLVVMVGTAAFIQRASCPRADGLTEGKASPAGC